MQSNLAVDVRERVGNLDEDSSNLVGVERLVVREAIASLSQRPERVLGRSRPDNARLAAEAPRR